MAAVDTAAVAAAFADTVVADIAVYFVVAGIVVEELLVNRKNPEAGVNDYKIFCYK